MGRYAKGVEGVEHYYLPDDLYKYAGEPFDVRISILDEPPEGGLWVAAPEDDISRSIGEVLDELVIGATPEQTEFIRENLLELDEEPHLSDALDWVSDIWHRFRDNDADLTICVNHGPDNISLEDTPREHMSTAVWHDGTYDYMLLDLVFEPGDMTLLGMLGERKQEFLLWMKGLIALYKLDIDPSNTEKHLRKRDDLEETREQLFFHNLVRPEGALGKLTITQQGRRAIGRLMEEQDELIERFDVFRDVVIRPSKDGGINAEFGTLSGADYRVAMYKHLGLDPFRAVFILSLLSGDLDDDFKGKGWLKVINDERFYEGLLGPVIDHATSSSEEELEELARQGEQYLMRTSALRQRAGYSQRVLQRAKTIQAFPRPSSDSSKTKALPSKRPFQKASEAAPSDEPGDPPALPEAPEPPSEPAPPELFPPPPPEEIKTRSTRKFRGRGPGRGPGPARGRSDEDDGWL